MELENEDIKKAKTYLKEYRATLYSMYDTAIQGIKLNGDKNWDKDFHAKDVYEAAIKLKTECKKKIEEIDCLINKM